MLLKNFHLEVTLVETKDSNKLLSAVLLLILMVLLMLLEQMVMFISLIKMDNLIQPSKLMMERYHQLLMRMESCSQEVRITNSVFSKLLEVNKL